MIKKHYPHKHIIAKTHTNKPTKPQKDKNSPNIQNVHKIQILNYTIL